MSYGTITVTRHGAVELIELTSADGMNCYTPEMGEDLVAALRAAAADTDVAAIVLTGAGRAFCAGAHRDVLTGALGPSGLRIGQEDFITCFPAEFAAIPKLTVAAFNGSAAGIGVTMSLLCDIRIAAPDAKLRLNFAELGIMPGLGSTHTLPRLVGPALARQLLLCSQTLTSAEAAAIGLVSEIVPADALLEHALALGTAAAKASGKLVAEIKTALHAANADLLSEAMRREAEAARRLRGG